MGNRDKEKGLNEYREIPDLFFSPLIKNYISFSASKILPLTKRPLPM